MNCEGKHQADSVDCQHREKIILMRQKLSAKRNAQKKPNTEPKSGFSRSKNADMEFPKIKPLINPWSFKNRSAAADMASIVNQSVQGPSAADKGTTYRDAVLFTAEEIMVITKEVFAGLAQCRSKEDQLGVIFNVAVKHIYGSKP